MNSTIQLYTTIVNISTTLVTNVTVDQHKDDFAPYISIIVFSILSIIFNFLVIFVLLYVPKLRRRNSNKFLLNLMMSNFCVGSVMVCFGVVAIILNFAEHTFDNHTEPPASISLIFCVLILLSVMNMILLSGDRLYTVKWTFRYFDSVRSRQVHTAIILPWIISVIYLVTLITLLQFGDEKFQNIVQHVMYISFDAIALIGFLTLVVASSFTYNEARRHLVRISSTNIAVANSSKQRKKNLRFREIRLALINIGLVIKFMVFWLPTIAMMTYHLIWKETTSEFVQNLSFHLVLINCLCDPTIYVLLSQDIRIVIQNVICKKQEITLATIGRSNVTNCRS